MSWGKLSFLKNNLLGYYSFCRNNEYKKIQVTLKFYKTQNIQTNFCLLYMYLDCSHAQKNTN